MSAEVLERKDLQLTVTCWQCRGTGLMKRIPCDICSGKGEWLTVFGQDVVAVVKRFSDKDTK